MHAQIKKWGNSLAVRIPKVMVETFAFTDGSAVNLEVEEGRLIVEPKETFTLSDFMVGLSEENRHEPADINPIGCEIL